MDNIFVEVIEDPEKELQAVYDQACAQMQRAEEAEEALAEACLMLDSMLTGPLSFDRIRSFLSKHMDKYRKG